VRLGGNICLSPSAIATFLQKAGSNLQELDLSGCQVNDEVRPSPCRGDVQPVLPSDPIPHGPCVGERRS
jgi:hypothetical protein